MVQHLEQGKEFRNYQVTVADYGIPSEVQIPLLNFYFQCQTY